MSARTDLRGARWSAAVRCTAKAEHQALEIPGDESATAFLQGAFARGVNAADNWVDQLRRDALDSGEEILTEVPVAWGPGDIWHGHADVVMPAEQIVLEAYHSVGGEFREEKALQVAFYAMKLGPGYRAMLHALDTTELQPDDGGFTITPYAVDVAGLTSRVHDIEDRVIAAYQAGVVNLDDRVGDTPEHSECRQCQFREPCWLGWEPPPVDEHPELADTLDRLVLAQSNAHHLRVVADDADQLVRDLKTQIRPFIAPGHSIVAGGIRAKRILVAPRKGFRLSDYIKAGHIVTPTMRDFATESDHPGERWYVKRQDDA